jgi:hypothetical protein
VVDYSIAAIPTEYKGRVYRSRLEARWAAFFDRLELEFEYEPFDLGKWSPDFLLRDISTLVEVKPLTAFDPNVWAKMIAAHKERGLDQSLLLTMVAPKLDGVVYIGWLAIPWRDQTMTPLAAGIGWYPADSRPAFISDIVCYISNGFISAGGKSVKLEGFGFGDCSNFPDSYHDYTMEQWARATEDVQYNPE